MIWVKDRTGRFRQRPHYEPEELDDQCEEVISSFLRRRYGSVQYPVLTDDLTRLIEECAEDLDAYADLSTEGANVEGLTEFIPGRRPRVRISRAISERPELENRFRTTLTHEFGHVKFHDFMFQMQAAPSLFRVPTVQETAKCERGGIISSPQHDWLEWQAGYVCGAILMPRHALQERVRDHRRAASLGLAVIEAGSVEGDALIEDVVHGFAVSREAAKVRLLKLKLLNEAGLGARSLFQ